MELLGGVTITTYMFQQHWRIWDENAWKSIFEERSWLPLAYFSALFSNPLSSSFPFAALPSPTRSLSLSLFPSSTPFIRAALARRYTNTTVHYVCVCVREGDEMGMYSVQQMTQHLSTGHTQLFSHISETYTQFHLEEYICHKTLRKMVICNFRFSWIRTPSSFH